MSRTSLGRRLFAEWLGSLLLSGTVIGSGILGLQLSGGNAGLALLANTAATAAMLFVLITVLGPVSGAHFNPAVSLVMALRGELTPGAAGLYIPVQILGCLTGAVLAHAMFSLPLLESATTDRSGWPGMLSEAVATFALVLAILGTLSARPQAVPAAVALVIAAGYWWTPSTSFANPAITLARAFTDTFAGIRPADVPGFLAGQMIGAGAAFAAAAALFPKATRT